MAVFYYKAAAVDVCVCVTLIRSNDNNINNWLVYMRYLTCFTINCFINPGHAVCLGVTLYFNDRHSLSPSLPPSLPSSLPIISHYYIHRNTFSTIYHTYLSTLSLSFTNTHTHTHTLNMIKRLHND